MTIYRALIPVSAALLAGIGLGALSPGRIWPAAAGTLLCALILLRHILARRPAIVMPLIFCAGVGYLLPQPWLVPRLSENHVSRFADDAEWRIGGVIRGHPQVQPHRMTFTLAAELLQRGTQDITVRGNVRVTVRGSVPGLSGGDRVSLAGKLRPIRNFNNPGAFDYARFMALEDTRVRTYAAGEQIRVSERADDRTPDLMGAARQWVLAKMESALAGRSADAVAVLSALALGDRGGITPELHAAFIRSGLAHLLAISGLHVGMVASVVFGAAFWCLAWLPPLIRRGWTRKAAALGAFVAVLAYAMLAGLSPATQRAVVMSSAFLLTYWVARRHDWANALAAAGLIIALADPPVVLGPSFQLSFAAVGAILVGLALYRPAAAGGGDPLLVRVRKYIAGLAWISLLATLGTLPLVMYYFNQVSLIGVGANLVAVPAVGGIVLPAGLLGVLLAPFNTALAGVCWQTAALCLEGLLRVVQTFAAWPAAAVHTITPTLPEIALWAGGMVLAGAWRQRRARLVLLAVLPAALALDAGYWVLRRFDTRQMTVQTLDVGQGSATLLQLPGGYTVLVDGGGFADNAAFDVGKYIVAPFLWRQKIRSVDLVILTHANSDHLNGLLYILEHFKVGEIWSNQEPCGLAACRQWEEIIARRGIFHPLFSELPVESERQGVRFALLNPPADFLALRATEKWRETNNNSLVVQVTWGQVAVLFPGDIGHAAEDALLRRHPPEQLRSTILMVAHHGSRFSSKQAFLNAVEPREAIIAAGWDNRFGFPHPQVIERLQRVQCRIWRTDQGGAVRVVTDGHSYHIAQR